jgi:Periplasmic protease
LQGTRLYGLTAVSIAGTGITVDDVRSRLRGPSGTKVELVALRQDEDICDTIEFTVVRGKIPINSIEASYVTEQGCLYLKLGRFALNTIDEVFAAFRLSRTKPKAVIIDLRGNGGGYMHPSLILSDMFLKRGQTILYSEGAHYPRQDNLATGIGIFKTEPLVILVDEGSASASEIFAGAMQDWDRGLIVGRRTFGKGLVQRSFFLQDGSEIRLTVARYHTPSGRVIQTPYESGKRSEYYRKYYDRYVNGELFSRDSIQFPDSLKYTTLVQKRTVYGGGGIMPDYFIPEDTLGVNDFYVKLIRRGVLTEYANLYADSHRHELLADSLSFDGFCRNYEKIHAGPLFEGLIEYAAGKDIEPAEGEIAAAEHLIKVRLKSLMARTVFNTTGYWRVINNEADPEFKKALELIADWPKTFPSL